MDYYNKYLKYKNKYIQLKQIGGNECYVNCAFGLEIEMCMKNRSYIGEIVPPEIIALDASYCDNMMKQIIPFYKDNDSLNKIILDRDVTCNCVYDDISTIGSEIISPTLDYDNMIKYINQLCILDYDSDIQLLNKSNNQYHFTEGKESSNCGIHVHWSNEQLYKKYILNEDNTVNFNQLFLITYIFILSIIKKEHVYIDTTFCGRLGKHYSPITSMPNFTFKIILKDGKSHHYTIMLTDTEIINIDDIFNYKIDAVKKIDLLSNLKKYIMDNIEDKSIEAKLEGYDTTLFVLLEDMIDDLNKKKKKPKEIYYGYLFNELNKFSTYIPIREFEDKKYNHFKQELNNCLGKCKLYKLQNSIPKDNDAYIEIINNIIDFRQKSYVKIYEALFNNFHLEFRVFSLDNFFKLIKDSTDEITDEQYKTMIERELTDMVNKTKDEFCTILNDIITNLKFYQEYKNLKPLIESAISGRKETLAHPQK